MKHLRSLVINKYLLLCVFLGMFSCARQEDHIEQDASDFSQVTLSGIVFIPNKAGDICYMNEKRLNGSEWRTEIRTRSGSRLLINGEDLFVDDNYYGILESNDIVRIHSGVFVNGVLLDSQPYDSIYLVLYPKKEYWVKIGKFDVCVYARSEFVYIEPRFGRAYIEFDGKRLAINKSGEVRFEGGSIGNIHGKYVDEEFGRVVLKEGLPDWGKAEKGSPIRERKGSVL